MARDVDAELIESVRVRRRRLREAFLGGRLAARRNVTDNVLRVVFGVIAAAVICAGCAATSFVRSHTGSLAPVGTVGTPASAVVRR